MKISEAHMKLNRRCIISIKQSNNVFGLLSRMDEDIPVFIFNEDNKTFLQLYFSKNMKSKELLSPILARKDVVEKSSYYSITERINNVEAMKVISELLELPSVAMNNSYIRRDELFIEFRFHSNMSKEINDLLSKAVSMSHNFKIVRLSRPRPLRTRIDEMNKQSPLAVVRYSLPIPHENKLANYLARNYSETVAEIEGRSFTEKGVRVLLYSQTPLDYNELKIISTDDMIYETYIFENSIVEGRKKGNEARIPRIAFFLTIEGDKLIDTTFIPAAEAPEYISIMMSLQIDKQGHHPVLEYYSELDDEVWEWI
ncbi:MAG: hypothetical protein ACYDAO_10100 [Thermoplasmataceae archaeon]